MRRLLTSIGAGLALAAMAITLAPATRADDPFFGGAAISAYRGAITGAGNFGAPRYTTALLPACGTTNKGAIAFDTTAAVPKVCDGSTWTALGGLSSPVSGDYVWTGKATFGSALDATNTVRLGDVAGSVVFEGTANAFETILDATDPTVGDTTLHLPNLGAATSDTLAALAATQTFTNKTLTAPTINGTVATTGLLLPTFDLANADTTLSRSAAGVLAVEGIDLASVSGAQSLTNKTLVSFELGSAATDTTITRSAAGKVAVEGIDLVDLSSSQAISNKKITSNAQGFVLLNDANLRMGTVDDTSGGALNYSTWTPKQFRIGAGSASTSISFGLSGDIATNFGNGVCGSTGVCAQPTWNWMKGSAAAPEPNHWSQAYYGGSGGLTKALSAGSATAIIRIPVASDRGRGGWIRYRIFASDGTAQQVRAGHVQFAMVAEGTTETCAVYGNDALLTVNPDQTQDGSGAGAITSGTLTYQWGVSTSPTNACDLTLNAASSLTETTLEFSGIIETFGYNGTGTGEPVPQ